MRAMVSSCRFAIVSARRLLDSSRRQLVCDPSALYDLNNCASLREHFPCAACTDSVGDDQPAFVAADAPEENQPGACLVNGGEVGCEGAHHLTTRLCACA